MHTRPHKLTFSFITPAYNNPGEVGKLLESIRPEYPKDQSLEVIVVDDCSREDSIKKVVDGYGFARYIRLDKNSGPAVARNMGAKAAVNDILIFVDSDVILNEDTFPRIREKFEKDDSVEIWGGEYDIEPANPSISTKFKSLMVRSWCPKGNTVTVFLTRIGAIKKNIFEKFGGFDTNLKTASVEDYELARRLMKAGYTIYYDSSITVKHHFPSFRRQLKLFFHRSFMWMYIFRKHGELDNTCTTPLQGVVQLCGFFTVIFFVLSIMQIKFFAVFLFFLGLFILTNSRFFILTFKHEGLIFTLKAVPMALAISCSIVIGSAWGAAYYFLYKESSKERLNV